MSDPSTTGSERSVYLAGPIEADDDPRSWRDELRERFPEVDWIDPMDWQDEWEEDPSAVWQREMETVRNNAVLVCNIGDEAPRTTGTHHEIREAINHGQQVAIVPEGTVSQVYREIEDVQVFDDRDRAVRFLVWPDAAVASDGGVIPAQRTRPAGTNVGRAWEQTALANEADWGVQHPEELLSAINEEVGEIEQAYLEATHEGGDPGEVQDEIDDLGPLLLQLVESVRTHPMAFEPLPTADEAGGSR